MTFALALLTALAAQETPTMIAEAGYRGSAFADAWAPVFVRLKTVKEPFDGCLRIKVHGRMSDTRVYAYDVALVAPTDRRFTTEFFATGMEEEVSVELENRAGVVVASRLLPLKFTDAGVRQFLVLNDAVPSLREVESDYGIRQMRGNDENFPHAIAPLLAFDTILMSRPFELTHRQVDAIAQWIELGGRLIISSGPIAQDWRGSDIAPLLPVEVTGVEAVELHDDAGEPVTVPMASVRAKAGGEFAHVAGQPLGVRAARGRGEVIFLRIASGDRAPDVAWVRLWSDILENRRIDEQERDATAVTTMSFMERIGVFALDINGWGLLISLLGSIAYLLCIGPGGWLWGRRRGFGRAWLHFAGCVVIFTGVFGIVRTRFSPAAPRLHVISFEDHTAGAALVQSFTRFQADVGRTYEMRFSDGASTSVITQVPSELVAAAMPVPECREGVMRLPMPALTMQSVAAVRVDKPTVRCRRDAENPALIVIENDGPSLSGCILVARDSVRDVPDVGTGARVSVDLTSTEAIDFGQFVHRLAQLKVNENPGILAWSYWERVPAIGMGVALTFEERIRAQWKDERLGRWAPKRVRQRFVDLSAELTRGSMVFVGRHSEVRGVAIDASPERNVQGIVRAVIR